MKMCRLKMFFVFVFVFVYVSSIAQNNYYVLNVKGNVKVKKNGIALKTNDQISDRDILVFGSISDMVAVISTKNGRMIIKPKPTEKSSELVALVGELLTPGTGRLSTRAGKITNAIELKKFFVEDSIALLGTAKVWVSPAAYPMNNENFFFVRYNWNGEIINKKLNFDGDSIIISKEAIYKIDGISINQEEAVEPVFYYKKGSQVTPLGGFTILFPEEGSLATAVAAYKKNSNITGDILKQELYALLKDIIGRNIDRENASKWLHISCGVK